MGALRRLLEALVSLGPDPAAKPASTASVTLKGHLPFWRLSWAPSGFIAKSFNKVGASLSFLLPLVVGA